MKGFIFLIIVVFLNSVLFCGCKKYIDIEFTYNQPVIVVNGLVSDTGTFEVFVTKSLPINDEASELEVIMNASVKIFEDGLFLGNLEYMQSTISYKNELYTPRYGSNYRVDVELSPLQIVSIATRMPNIVPISDVTVIEQVIEETDEYSSSFKALLRVKLNDPSNEKNYYMVTASYGERGGSVWSSQPMTYKIFYKYLEGVSFTDQGLNGQEIVIDMDFRWTTSIDEESKSKTVILYSLSEELYKFLYSYNLNRDMNNLPQAEPVIIYSSAINGIGILGAYSISTYEF